jgi:hypothetical protein
MKKLFIASFLLLFAVPARAERAITRKELDCNSMQGVAAFYRDGAMTRPSRPLPMSAALQANDLGYSDAEFDDCEHALNERLINYIYSHPTLTPDAARSLCLKLYKCPNGAEKQRIGE